MASRVEAKRKSETRELRKKSQDGGNPGKPTVRDIHNPSSPRGYAGMVSQQTALVMK